MSPKALLVGFSSLSGAVIGGLFLSKATYADCNKPGVGSAVCGTPCQNYSEDYHDFSDNPGPFTYCTGSWHTYCASCGRKQNEIDCETYEVDRNCGSSGHYA